ncbi:hypothetical protein LCGC14_0991050, partial [marine sediment metagenome]
MAFELVSYADLKKLLTLTDAAITDYPPLEVINDSMVSVFEAHMGRKLEKVARTETFYVLGFPRKQVKLVGVPVASVASVTVTQSGIDTTFDENEEFDITNYGLRLWVAVKNVKIVVTYTGGLALVTEEPNLNRAALYQ